MKLKPQAPEELAAKIEFMLATDVILSEADLSFLQQLLPRLRQHTSGLSKATLARLERIFELDDSRKVYRVKTSTGWHPTPSFTPIDPFVDVGKKVRKGRRR